jgi:hypothetical protein
MPWRIWGSEGVDRSSEFEIERYDKEKSVLVITGQIVARFLLLVLGTWEPDNAPGWLQHRVPRNADNSHAMELLIPDNKQLLILSTDNRYGLFRKRWHCSTVVKFAGVRRYVLVLNVYNILHHVRLFLLLLSCHFLSHHKTGNLVVRPQNSRIFSSLSRSSWESSFDSWTIHCVPPEVLHPICYFPIFSTLLLVSNGMEVSWLYGTAFVYGHSITFQPNWLILISTVHLWHNLPSSKRMQLPFQLFFSSNKGK